MTPQQKAQYRMMFQNRLSKLAGMAFQNLFSEIMGYANPNFQPVKPQGNIGDRKNDGHDPRAGRYYQVYSPEVFDESSAIKKLEEDFAGLMTYWGDKTVYPNGVQEFWFVLNDHYRVTPGGYPTTIATLEKLKQAHGLTACGLLLSKHLEDVLLGLPEDQIIAVVGYAPNPADLKVLKLDLVHEIVTHIIENTMPQSLNESLVDPDFDEKITFNQLVATGAWLRNANYRCGTLEEYFKANSNFTRQEVRNRLKGIYEASATKDFPDGEGNATLEDQRLFYILKEVAPTPPNQDRRLEKELQDAALVILAYFFESCDIFEEPVAC